VGKRGKTKREGDLASEAPRRDQREPARPPWPPPPSRTRSRRRTNARSDRRPRVPGRPPRSRPARPAIRRGSSRRDDPTSRDPAGPGEGPGDGARGAAPLCATCGASRRGREARRGEGRHRARSNAGRSRRRYGSAPKRSSTSCPGSWQAPRQRRGMGYRGLPRSACARPCRLAACGGRMWRPGAARRAGREHGTGAPSGDLGA
jgi:hypothetical protein